MAKYRWMKVICALALTLGVTASSLGIFAFAATHSSTASAHTVFTPKLSAKKGPQLKIQDLHTVNAAAVPKASQAALQQANRSVSPVIPAQVRAKEAKTSLAKRAAAAPHNAGETLLSPSRSTLGPSMGTPDFPSTFNKFAGQSDTSGTCANSEFCTTPFPSVAAAPTGLALQIVDGSLDLYNSNGVQQSGWPKTAKSFFGVPNPSPSGCDTNGPALYEPRAWFDAYDNRWGVSILQTEGASGFGTGCAFVSRLWIATSTSNNPSGTWRVFAFNMTFGADPAAVADLPEFGYDADGLFFTANMFGASGFEYAESVGCGKQSIYAGGSIVCNTFYDFGGTNSNNVAIEFDSLAPAESLSTDFSPHAEFLVNTFNIDGDLGAHDCVTTACNGIIVWTWSDPANTSGVGDLLIGTISGTANSYVEPPFADEPSCTGGVGCMDVFLDEIDGIPTYHAGHLYFAHETGVTNASSQFVVGIQWFDIEPNLLAGWPTESAGFTEVQEGILNAKNNWLSCTNPVIMPDLDDDLILGYDYMGDTQFPSINYTFRRVTDPGSTLTGGLGIVETSGTASTSDTEWGLWSGMSYPATYQDFVWLTSAYSTSSSWSTELIKLRFNLNG